MQNNKCCLFSMFALVNMQYQAFPSEVIGTALTRVACCRCAMACGTDIWRQSHSKAFLVSCLRYVCLFMSHITLNEEKYSFSPVRPPLHIPAVLLCDHREGKRPRHSLNNIVHPPHTTPILFAGVFFLIWWHFLLISPVVLLIYLFAEPNVYLPLPLAPSMPWY